ncbi:MAG: type 4a pilus biogenesis protein PilO [Desulfonauticus sp.]|nr:type 4a pilus biogenesis protein PilO [Desulfonauticus sp.]
MLVFVGLVGYFGVYSSYEKQVELSKQIQNLEKNIAKLRVTASRLKKVQKDRDSYQKQFILAKTLLPEDARALEKLLASFEKKGIEKGIEFMYFRPLGETKYDFYAARQVQIRVLGSFHNIVSYLDGLTSLPRLVSLQHIKFLPQGSQNGISHVLADCNLQVYRALTEAEMAAKKRGKKKKR